MWATHSMTQTMDSSDTKAGTDEALGVIRSLAVDIGPRRPCSDEEKQAAEVLERWLAERNVAGRREPSGDMPRSDIPTR